MKRQFQVRRFNVRITMLLCALLVLGTENSQELRSQPAFADSSRFSENPQNVPPALEERNGSREDERSNQRIVTIKVASVPALLKPDDRVDVFVTLPTLESAPTTELAVENVAVFAMNQGSVSLLVSRDQATKLVAASGMGTFILAIVHEPQDASAKDTSLIDVDDGLRFRLNNKHDRLILRTKSSKIIVADKSIPRALVHNPEIVRAIAIAPNQLQISALKPGVTQLNVWDEFAELMSLDILVTRDTSQLDLLLKHVYPDVSLEVVPLETSVLLRGTVANPDDANRIIRIAEDYYPKVINFLTVRGADEREADEANRDEDSTVVQLDRPLRKQQLDAMKALHQDVVQLRGEVRQLIEVLEKQNAREAPGAQADRQPSDLEPADDIHDLRSSVSSTAPASSWTLELGSAR